MIEITELVRNVPDGKKIKHIGSSYYSALVNYYEEFRDVESIEIDDLISQEFKDLVLNKDFIRDLILFEPTRLSEICRESDISNISLSEIKDRLIKYYSFTYESDLTHEIKVSKVSNCKFTLHDFQERIRRKVINLIFQNQRRFLIHMPTGSGKTRTAAEVIIDFIRLSSSKALLNDKLKILWIAQSSELCFQAYETIRWLTEKKGTSDIRFGHFYDKYELDKDIEKNSAIIFCTIQKLLLHYKKPLWQKIKNNNYLVVVDEAHRSVASKWVQALNNFVSDNSTYLLGLTATPGLGGKEDKSNYSLSSYYQGNKISITDTNYTEIESPISYLVNKGFLAKLERINIDSYVDIEDKVKKDEFDNFKFSGKTLKQLSKSPTRNSSIVNIIKENFEASKKILVFTCGVDHNRILKTILSDLDIRSETVDAKSKNRNSIIEKFKHQDLKILLNYGVLTTGFDAPKTDVCIIARPISSVVMYSQMVGRILRGPKNNGNKLNTLYTIKDNLNHGDYDKMFNSFNDYYK